MRLIRSGINASKPGSVYVTNCQTAPHNRRWGITRRCQHQINSEGRLMREDVPLGNIGIMFRFFVQNFTTLYLWILTT
jgi:hypothetical protein